MTVGIYIRVSTQEQASEGYSIAAQQERLVAYCKAQGWTDYKFYIDEGVSAKDTNRPKLTLLLSHVKKDKIKMILVYRLDRFTRSVSDLYNLLKTLDKHQCAFKSATELYDTSSAMGRMFIGLVALLAQWETENLSERVKMALEKKVSGGERVGGIPYGFDLNEQEKLVANERSEVILDMIDKIESGMSATALADFLTDTNKDKDEWRTNTVLRILKNPALYGATRWNDAVYENTHEGIITKSRFMKLQQMLDDRAQHFRREVKSDYLFQGVISCPQCKHPMAVNRYLRKRKKDDSEFQRAIYRCQRCRKAGNPFPSIGEYRFLDALYTYMENVKIEPVEIKVENNELEQLVKKLKDIEKKREKYQRAWAADKMTDEEFEKLMDETRDVYEKLKLKIANYEAPVPVNTEDLKEIVLSFNENFKYLTNEEKREFVSRFFRRIHFKLIPQPPARADQSKVGKDLVVIYDVQFY